jgi:hypothetical protein
MATKSRSLASKRASVLRTSPGKLGIAQALAYASIGCAIAARKGGIRAVHLLSKEGASGQESNAASRRRCGSGLGGSIELAIAYRERSNAGFDEGRDRGVKGCEVQVVESRKTWKAKYASARLYLSPKRSMRREARSIPSLGGWQLTGFTPD